MGPLYHNPVFLQTEYYRDPETFAITSNINLGNVSGDTIYYQFKTLDYEGDTLNYSLSNANLIPGNITINATTGWLSGYINRDLCLPTHYTFQVTAYKTANNSYSTTESVILTVENPINQHIVWNSDTQLGNVYPGIPSTLQVQAEVIQPFSIPVSSGAKANCTMKLVDVDIVNGGTGFFIGNSLTVLGGVSSSNVNAIITVTGVDDTTQAITSVSISPTIQNYIELPKSLTVVWDNPNATDTNIAYNAILKLNFGVDQINILDGGNFYDTATIGFDDAGETSPASSNVSIYNGSIVAATVLNTGQNYTAIPKVVIQGKTLITPENPISYSYASGSLPTGMKLLSNGLLVGMPSSQYFSLDQNTFFDSDTTNFDLSFTFTVNASVGTNKAIDFIETDIIHPAAGQSNVVVQDFQTLVMSQNTFTLNLIDKNNIMPKTNLSLEFLLDDEDLTTLYAPLNDESIVSNDSIYRSGDFYFGIPSHVRMLMAYGISALLPDNIVAAISKYHHNKTFLFNSLKWAQSTTDGYEVIYIEPLDEFTNINGQSFSGSISLPLTAPEVTVDTDLYVSDSNNLRASDINQVIAYPATLDNMIMQLNQQLSAFDIDFLPSWMTDVQPDGNILGFVPAIPLVYVKPNQGKRILYYLQQYYDINGGLNSIQAITDRYVWNAGYVKNWNPRPTVSITGNNTLGSLAGTSTFTVNTSIPLSYTPNLTPRTITYL